MQIVQQHAARWAVLAIMVGTPAFLLMVAYCQLWSGEEAVPLRVSIEWAGRTVGNWLLFAAGIWLLRAPLQRRFERGRPEDLTEAGGLIFLVAATVVLGSAALMHWSYSGAVDVSAVVRRLLRLSPVLALVAVGITATMVAVKGRQPRAASNVRIGEPAARAPEWIELPEAPLLRLRPGEVSVIRTARNYCEIPVAGRELLIRITAKQLEERLAPHGFARVHRSLIVNLARVAAMEERSGRRLLLLDDGSRLPVSRSYRDEVAQRLSATRH